MTKMQVAVIVYKAPKPFPTITDHYRDTLCRTKKAAISLFWRNVPDKLELFKKGYHNSEASHNHVSVTWQRLVELKILVDIL